MDVKEESAVEIQGALTGQIAWFSTYRETFPAKKQAQENFDKACEAWKRRMYETVGSKVKKIDPRCGTPELEEVQSSSEGVEKTGYQSRSDTTLLIVSHPDKVIITLNEFIPGHGSKSDEACSKWKKLVDSLFRNYEPFVFRTCGEPPKTNPWDHWPEAKILLAVTPGTVKARKGSLDVTLFGDPSSNDLYNHQQSRCADWSRRVDDFYKGHLIYRTCLHGTPNQVDWDTELVGGDEKTGSGARRVTVSGSIRGEGAAWYFR